MILNNFKGQVFAGDQQVSQIYHGTVPLWQDEVIDLNKDTQIAFLFDTTGSMRNEINAVRQLAIAVAQKSVELGSNLQFALSGFKDEDDGFSPALDFTDINTFISRMPSSTSGGGDGPENGFGAIVHAKYTYSWDPAFNHSIFLFTDNISHSRGALFSQALESLNEINASFYYGTHPGIASYVSNYQALADNTGGFFFNSIQSFTRQLEAQQAN